MGGRTRTSLVAVLALLAVGVASSGGAVSVPRPHLDVFRVKTFRSGDSELVIRFGGKIPNCIQNSRQIDAAKVKIAFKTKGISYSLSNIWCAPTLTDGAYPVVLGYLRDWTERGDFFESFHESLAQRDITLTPSEVAPSYLGHPADSARKTFVFGYWVTINGNLARKGRLRVTLDYRVRTIWEDEDDFVNICINDLKKIYSSGGRLYCRSSWSTHSMKMLR